jgi:hypothetical protein
VKGKHGETTWRRPNYVTIHRMIENPIYGGAYAQTAVAASYDAAGVNVKIRREPRSDWLALMLCNRSHLPAIRRCGPCQLAGG